MARALAVLWLLAWSCAGAAQAGSLAAADYGAVKRTLLGEVFADQRRTLYCGCPFDAAKRPDLAACGYRSAGDPARARRVEVEHVVPAAELGRGRACWRQKLCRDAGGKPFKGRRCCLAIDPAFRAAYQDLHNLWPALGEINAARRDYRFGEIPGEARAFGRCDFEIDPAARIAEPRPAVRGDLARIQLYMAKTYRLPLAPGQRRLLERWSAADPVDAAEAARQARIVRLQGDGNPHAQDQASVNAVQGAASRRPTVAYPDPTLGSGG